MTKREVAKLLRSKLTNAIRALPNDIEYQGVGVHEDITNQFERDREAGYGGSIPDHEGTLHIIELTVEEVRSEM